MAVISLSYKQLFEVIAISVLFLLANTILPTLNYDIVFFAFTIGYVASIYFIQEYNHRIKEFVEVEFASFKRFHREKLEGINENEVFIEIRNNLGLSMVLSIILFVLATGTYGTAISCTFIAGAISLVAFAIQSTANTDAFWRKVLENDLVKASALTEDRIKIMVSHYFNMVEYGKEIMNDLDEMGVVHEKIDFSESDTIANQLLVSNDLDEVKRLTLELKNSTTNMVEVLGELEDLYNDSLEYFEQENSEELNETNNASSVSNTSSTNKESTNVIESTGITSDGS